MDFELSSEPAPYILGLVGAFIGVFTASGGFNSAGYEQPGLIMKAIIMLGGFAIGYFWGIWKSGS
jgi:hypothetical protein